MTEIVYDSPEIELYRGRQTDATRAIHRLAAAFVLLAFVVGLVVASTLEQYCFTPFAAHNNDIDVLSKDLTTPKRCWWFGLFGLLCFLVFVLGGTLMRSFPFASLVGLLVSAIGVIPVVVIFPLDSLFEYLKLFSVMGGVVFIQTYRLDVSYLHAVATKSGAFDGDDAWSKARRGFCQALRPLRLHELGAWKWFLYLTLVVNISEAVSFDAKGGNYFNVVAGAWCVLAMPRSLVVSCPETDRRAFFFTFLRRKWTKIVYVDNTDVGERDFVYETPWFWIFMYTSWDAAFAYAEKTEHFFVVVVVLVAALYGNASFKRPLKFFEIDPHLYIQFRAFTLCTRYVVLGYFDVYEAVVDSSRWYDADVARGWGIFNVACISVYMAYRALRFDGKESRASADVGSVVQVGTAAEG